MKKALKLSVLLSFLVLSISFASAETCDVCNITCTPCGGGCTATDLTELFVDVTDFNNTIGDITGWNTSCIVNMHSMFQNSDFNQDISSWDVSHVTDTAMMFNDATSFDQNLASWNISSITDMTNMFGGITLSTTNYDALLNGLINTAPSGITFGAGFSTYSTVGKTSHDILSSTYGWTITDGGYLFVGGDGSEFDPYQISTCQDLQSMESYTNGEYYILNNNINCSDTINWNGGLGFKPIGMFAQANLNFDGQGYNISDIYININDASGGEIGGLFGYLGPGYIHNFSLININITSDGSTEEIGGVIAWTEGGTFSDIYVSGNINGPYAGGVLGGTGQEGVYSNIHSDVNVIGNYWIAGFTPQLGYNEVYTNIQIDGNLTNIGGSEYGDNVAGFAVMGDTSIITNVVVTSTITWQGNDTPMIAGFISQVGSSDIINNSMFTGKVVTAYPENAGAFIATSSGTEICNNNFFDNTTSLVQNAICATPKTTEEMVTQSTFTNWDFTDTWAIDNRLSYPYLQIFNNPYYPDLPLIITTQPDNKSIYYFNRIQSEIICNRGAGTITYSTDSELITINSSTGVITSIFPTKENIGNQTITVNCTDTVDMLSTTFNVEIMDKELSPSSYIWFSPNGNDNAVVVCSANESDGYTCGSEIDGTERYATWDFNNTFETSSTIDTCVDGAMMAPLQGEMLDNYFEMSIGINVTDLTQTDTFRRVGDTIQIDLIALCSVDGDRYNILYKNSTNPSDEWQSLTSGVCVSEDYETYLSQVKIINVSKVLDNIVGNHTIRTIVNYGGEQAGLTCGSDITEPDWEKYSDTDDLVIEVLGEIESSPPIFNGTGTLEDPYQIATCVQLQNMSTELGSSYILIQDIDCSDTINWENIYGMGFTAIDGFAWASGSDIPSINGQGFAINNLYINITNPDGCTGFICQQNTDLVMSNIIFNNLTIINNDITATAYDLGIISDVYANITYENISVNNFILYTGASYVALFGAFGGDNDLIINVNNVNVTNGYIGTSEYPQGPSAVIFADASPYVYIRNTNIENVNVSGCNVGGFIGSGLHGEIINSHYKGEISAMVDCTDSPQPAYFGGLIGDSTEFLINNSYANGKIYGWGTRIGGLIGGTTSSSLLYNSYSSMGIISSAGNGIGLGTCTDVFFDSDKSNTTNDGCTGSTAKTTSEMVLGATFTNWDFTDTWSIDEGLSYPYLQQFNNPYYPELPPTCSVCNETCSPCGGGCNATNLDSMFQGITDFDTTVGDVTGWNTSCITDMTSLFSSSDFNQDISGWDVSQVTSMAAMFESSPFNYSLNSWDTSSVTSMSEMFADNIVFNQNITGWEVSNVTNMYYMFGGATSFDQDLSGWDVSSVTDMGDMFMGDNLSISNYDSLLNGWSAQSLQSGVTFSGGSSQYSTIGKVGRDILTDTYDWIITDGGANNNAPTVSDVSVSPSSGYVTDSFGCNYNFTDADNDTDQSIIDWFVNEVYDSTGVSYIAQNELDNITCQVTPYDGIDYGTPVNSSVMQVSNWIPEVINIAITPDPAYDNDTLSCGYDYVDADSNDDFSTIRWIVDGIENSTTTTISNISSGSTVICEVTPYDGIDYGTPVNSSELVILSYNTAPVLQSIPNQSVQHNIQSLGYQAICTDANNDSLYYYDNIPFFDINASGYISHTPTLSQVGIYPITITCGDGTENATTEFVYTITNTAPTTGAATHILVSINNSLYCNGTDPENDDLNYTWTITKDGSAYSNGTTGSVASGVTAYVTSLINPVGGSYNFTCIATDGVDSASNTASVLFNGTNQPPTVDTATLTANRQTSDATLTGNCSATDPELNSMNYTHYLYRNNVIVSTQQISSNSIQYGNLIRGYNYKYGCIATDSFGLQSTQLNASTTFTPTNTAPYVGSVSITTPIQSSDLPSIPILLRDYDGDYIAWQNYSWYNNGVLIYGPTTQSIASSIAYGYGDGTTLDFTLPSYYNNGSYYSPGDNLTFTIQLYDPSYNYSSLYTSSKIAVEMNTAPHSPVATLTSPLYEDSPVVAQCSVTDDNYDHISFKWSLYQNGTLQQSGSAIANSGEVKTLANLSPSTLWPVGTNFSLNCYNFTDGSAYSATNGTANVTSITKPAVSTGARITPTLPISTDTLLLFCNGSDIGNETLAYDYNVYVDNVLNISGTTSRIYPPSIEYNIANISASGLTTKGVILSCLAKDVMNQSLGWINSTEVFVDNSPPIINSARVNGSTNDSKYYVDSTLTGFCYANDSNSHKVRFNYKWYKNGALWLNATTTEGYGYFTNQENPVTTISGGMVRGDNITFSCQAFNTLSSDWVTSSPVTISNSIPVISSTSTYTFTFEDDILITYCKVDYANATGQILYNWNITQNGVLVGSNSTLADSGTDLALMTLVNYSSGDQYQVSCSGTVDNLTSSSLQLFTVTGSSPLQISVPSVITYNNGPTVTLTTTVTRTISVDIYVTSIDEPQTLEQIFNQATGGTYGGGGSYYGIPSDVTYDQSSPVSTNVFVTPANPLTTTTLSCTYDYFDANADSDNSVIRWWVDGALYSTDTHISNLPQGSRVNCSVIPYDGIEPGVEVFSANQVTIRNSAPVPTITYSPSTVYANMSVNTTCKVVDVDAPGLVNYTWSITKNGGTIGSGSGNYTQSTTIPLMTITGLVKNDLVSITCTGDDSLYQGTLIQSFIVQSSLPLITSIPVFNNSAPTVNTSLKIINISTYSLDGANVTLSYKWYINGFLVPSATNDTLDLTPYAVGDVIYARVTPNDGTLDGTTMAVSSVTIASGLSVSGTTLTPTLLWAGDNVTLSSQCHVAAGLNATMYWEWYVNSVIKSSGSKNVTPDTLTQLSILNNSVISNALVVANVWCGDGSVNTTKTVASLIARTDAPITIVTPATTTLPISDNNVDIGYSVNFVATTCSVIIYREDGINVTIPLASCQNTTTVIKPNTNYYLKVFATDSLNNTRSATSVTFQRVVDTTPSGSGSGDSTTTERAATVTEKVFVSSGTNSTSLSFDKLMSCLADPEKSCNWKDNQDWLAALLVIGAVIILYLFRNETLSTMKNGRRPRL